MYIKKKYYFTLIIHQVNKHRDSRRWFTEADVKHFKSGTLRTITNITRSMVNWKKKKRIPLQVYFKDFVHSRGFSKHFVMPPFLCFKLILSKAKGLFYHQRHEEISRGSAKCCKPPSRSRAEPWWGTKRQSTRKLSEFGLWESLTLA